MVSAWGGRRSDREWCSFQYPRVDGHKPFSNYRVAGGSSDIVLSAAKTSRQLGPSPIFGANRRLGDAAGRVDPSIERTVSFHGRLRNRNGGGIKAKIPGKVDMVVSLAATDRAGLHTGCCGPE